MLDRSHVFAVSVLVALFASAVTPAQEKAPENAAQKKQPKVGYNDGPVLPNSKWRVHDGNRPQPVVVTPGTASTAERAGTAPSDAIVLFDGKDLSAWKGGKGPARWKVENGYMEVNKTGGIRTAQEFGDCQLHIEFATPAEVVGDSQGRGNSGVFLMGRYEVQVLDSYKNATYPDGQAAALYGQTPPLVNASRPPGAWQTYDIIFEAPRFDGDKLLRPGYMTVIHNGVVVHHRRELIGGTTHRRLAKYTPHPPAGPIQLQDHGNPTRFRNIWVRPLRDYDAQ